MTFWKWERKRTDEWLLGLATFVIGIGVMAVEITASRLLAPYFGASLFVWTSLIVTVLLALSVGYWIGGIAASKGVGVEAVGYLLLTAAGFLLFGVVALPNFSSSITGVMISMSSASIALFLGSLLVTMVIFALPVTLLAMSGPVLLKAWSALGDVGRISGRYFAVSTIGSVIGTVMPTLVLVPELGARSTVMAVALMFLLMGLMLVPKKRVLGALVALPAFAATSAMTPPPPPDAVAELESPYQFIRVADQDDRRYLIFNEGAGVQSVHMKNGGRTGMYYDYMAVAPFMRPRRPDGHKVLVLGLAAGSVPRHYGEFLPDGERVEYVGVEVDAAVIDVARKYFGLDELPVRVVNEDGRTFLANDRERYDVVIADAYSTQLYIPPHLATREFFALAKTRLLPGGVFVMNVNAPSPDSRLLKALVNSLSATYPHVLVVPVQESWNHLVFASDEPLDPEAASRAVPAGFEDVSRSLSRAWTATYDPSAETFTDDRAPVEFLTDAMIVAQALER